MPVSDKPARPRSDWGGAATIDWVVLTSAFIGLGLAVLGAFPDATEATAGSRSDRLGDTPGDLGVAAEATAAIDGD